jgi:predicted N-acetyltransferase YhbS
MVPGRFGIVCLMTSDVPAVSTRPTMPADLPAIAALQARAFSPGRFARTAYRIREGAPDFSPYCRVALMGDRLIAAVRMTPITIGGRSGALLLGPLAVEPELAGRGYARRLVAEALDAARSGGEALVLLVGDMAYYGRLGFTLVPPGRIMLPGPVDPARLLAAELEPGALEKFRGMVAAHS